MNVAAPRNIAVDAGEGVAVAVKHYRQTTDFDHRRVTVNDPWISLDNGKTAAELADVRIRRGEFDRMARFGKAKEKAAVLIGPRRRAA